MESDSKDSRRFKKSTARSDRSTIDLFAIDNRTRKRREMDAENNDCLPNGCKDNDEGATVSAKLNSLQRLSFLFCIYLVNNLVL